MKRLSKAITCLLLCTLLVGCSGRRELNDVLLVSSVGVDAGKNGKTDVHIQVVHAGGTAGNQGGAPSGGVGGSVYTYTVSGRTVYDALQIAGRIAPRYLVYSHINSVIVGEEYAKKVGLKPMFDFMERNYEFRETVPVFIATRTTAKEVLSMYTAIFKIPSESLQNRLISSAMTTGFSNVVMEKDIVRQLYGEHTDPVIPGVRIYKPSKDDGNMSNLSDIRANNKNFIMTGLAVFNKDHFKRWMTYKESEAWTLAKGRARAVTLMTNSCPNRKKGHLAYVAKSIHSKLKPNIHGKDVTFTISISGKGYLQEVTCNMVTGNPKTLTKIEKLVSDEMKKNINTMIHRAKKDKVDILGLGQMLYETNPVLWRQKRQQDKSLSQFNIKVHVDMKLETTGARIESVNDQKK
ncbi:Germination protein, Ger(X)C [Fictibacillus macauensis ZFHKF-1]|uniref:Germination protein, Ger(X)C n=1 Tax=Fictibacillus macauensis ZFHKF-1 TaxID=1196324 RepID=I8J3H9_9BACL|nr:Ger(x)C family spore germination protein [Fictibacillus macauensis]EIT86331.1 Germination protein, Ger(X)C [Fictibacillus macauensis ZFHKF-1]